MNKVTSEIMVARKPPLAWLAFFTIFSMAVAPSGPMSDRTCALSSPVMASSPKRLPEVIMINTNIAGKAKMVKNAMAPA